MAQQNRRRARKGGTSKPGNGRLADGADPEASKADPAANGARSDFPELESGEDQLTEASMAAGRPAPEEVPSAEELDAFEAADEASAPAAGALSTRTQPRRRDTESHAPAVVDRAPRQNPVLQLVGFAQGSYRELQRVQWPDRRQVFQATGVVLGFVIVAGAFLGVASWAAQKVVNLILYGHG